VVLLLARRFWLTRCAILDQLYLMAAGLVGVAPRDPAFLQSVELPPAADSVARRDMTASLFM